MVVQRQITTIQLAPNKHMFVFTETAGDHPDVDTDDVINTTESELAVSSGGVGDF